MGLITRILFGKKKTKPIETKPIETKPIETKIISVSLNGFDFRDIKITQNDYYYVIIKKILDLIKSGSCKIDSERIIYKNEEFSISYYLKDDDYKKNILYIYKPSGGLMVAYDLSKEYGKAEGKELISIAISQRLENERIRLENERIMQINVERKEIEQSILKHF